MNESVHGLALLETFPQMRNHIVGNAQSVCKFLQVKRIHFHFVQITHGNAAQVVQFDTQERAAHYIFVAAFFDQKLDGGHHFLALLHLIEKDERFARHQFAVRERRQAQKQVLGAFSLLKQFQGFGPFNEVDLDKMFKTCLSHLSDGEGFPHLTGTCNEQCTLVVEEIILHLIFLLAFDHGLICYKSAAKIRKFYIPQYKFTHFFTLFQWKIMLFITLFQY